MLGPRTVLGAVSTPVLLLFGFLVPEGASSALERALARIEQDAVRALSAHGFEVRPAPKGALRPSAGDAGPRAKDLAARESVDRMVILDFDSAAREIWISHHLRGARGPWDIRKVPCEPGQAFECAPFLEQLLLGLRPRRHLDIDLGTELRAQAKPVTRCVRRERRRPLAERLHGEVFVVLEVRPSGRGVVRAIAPAQAATGPLGRCLRAVFQRLDVGPFEGPTLSLRLPIEL